MDESINGYSCPKCDKVADETTLISHTKPEFIDGPDPGLRWREYHKCSCGCLYMLRNGA